MPLEPIWDLDDPEPMPQPSEAPSPWLLRQQRRAKRREERKRQWEKRGSAQVVPSVRQLQPGPFLPYHPTHVPVVPESYPVYFTNTAPGYMAAPVHIQPPQYDTQGLLLKHEMPRVIAAMNRRVADKIYAGR